MTKASNFCVLLPSALVVLHPLCYKIAVMNFKYINRKQRIGISHLADFLDWALLKANKAEKKAVYLDSKNIYQLVNDGHQLWESYRPVQMQITIERFNAAIEELELDFNHCDMEDTVLAQTARSIHSEARELELYFSIIDLRLISELGKDLSDFDLLDRMVVECGCNPLGDRWVKYTPEYGRQELQALLEQEGETTTKSNARRARNHSLSNRFLACFDKSVRFYGNAAFDPTVPKHLRESVVKSKNLQSRHDFDSGLILRDDEHIGFILLAQDYY